MDSILKFSGKKLVKTDTDPDSHRQTLDDDPIWQNTAYPTGSGSTTLGNV
jgi:hypothetical protein